MGDGSMTMPGHVVLLQVEAVQELLKGNLADPSIHDHKVRSC